MLKSTILLGKAWSSKVSADIQVYAYFPGLLIKAAIVELLADSDLVKEFKYENISLKSVELGKETC